MIKTKTNKEESSAKVTLVHQTDKLSKAKYEKHLAKLHVELVKLQYWIKQKGLQVVIVFEGRDAAGKFQHGGDHQADHRTFESQGLYGCRPGQAFRPRENSMVLSALRAPSSGRRRNGAFRQKLVQSRWCGTGDGILQQPGIQRISAVLSGIRTNAGSFRNYRPQILVFRQR